MVLRRCALICLLLFGCGKKETTPEKPCNDFESLMGSCFPEWRYVQTEEDRDNLAFFKNIYEQNIGRLTASQKEA